MEKDVVSGSKTYHLSFRKGFEANKRVDSSSFRERTIC